jgi:hypothetical protein
MRVRVLLLTSGIRAVLSCSLNISCSSPSHASLGPQPTAGTSVVPAHPSSPTQTSSSSSEATPSPRSSPPLARHVRITVLALGRLERAAPAGGRGCRGRGTRASGGRDCSDSGKRGKAGDGGTGTSKGRIRSSSGDGGTSSPVSTDNDRDNELKLAREAAREQAAQWADVHPQGHRGGSPNGRGRAGDAPSGGMRGGRVPDGGGSPDRHGRAAGWVDGDRGLYRRRGSPSSDRYHGHHGIQAIVRDVGPGSRWPILTKTSYIEWVTVMRVRLQVRHMWETVRYGDVDYYEDRRTLDALIAAVPSKMQFSLSKKRTTKEAWDAIAAARIGSDRARKTTLQVLRKEWV